MTEQVDRQLLWQLANYAAEKGTYERERAIVESFIKNFYRKDQERLLNLALEDGYATL